MAVIFADSFDPYAALGDMTTGQWSLAPGALQATTAFGTGKSYQMTTIASTATFTSASNETTVYGSIRVLQPTGTSAQYSALTFTDGGTAQTTVRWNADGSIGLYSGGPTGTLLQTYAGIFLPGTWHGYQFKIVINNTTGSIEIRMDGSTSNVITKTSVNTRAGTANSYVNGISLIAAGVVGNVDDLLINNTSGNAPTSWPGDVRAVQQTPVTTTSSNFSVIPATAIQNSPTVFSTLSETANTVIYVRFTANTSGTIASVVFQLNAGITGNVKLAIYDATGIAGGPNNLLGTSSTVNNPTTGNNTASFSSPPLVAAGTNYFIAFNQDTTTVWKDSSTNQTTFTGTTTFASFPVNNPTAISGPVSQQVHVWTINYTADNTFGVQELVQDGDTSYVYTSSIVEDKYSMSAIATSYSVIAMQYFACYKRSDVGSRTMQLGVTAGTPPATAFESATATAVTLSGSNLVATNTGTTSTNQGAHVAFTGGLTTGKYYFEVTLTTYTGGAGVGVGIGNASSTYSALSGSYSGGDMCLVVGHTGTGVITNLAGNSGTSLGALTSGDVIGVAVDITNGKIWFRKGAVGPWLGSAVNGDPTNPTSGGGLGIPAGTIVPFVTFGSGLSGAAGVAGNVFTANFGATSFTGAVPSGYTSGWPAVASEFALFTDAAISNTYAFKFKTLELDPTSAAWTVGNVNSAILGLSVTA